jgi:hypothetical protein
LVLNGPAERFGLAICYHTIIKQKEFLSSTKRKIKRVDHRRKAGGAHPADRELAAVSKGKKRGLGMPSVVTSGAGQMPSYFF